MLLLQVVAVLAVETAVSPCEVAGRVTASTIPLPGVALTVSDGTAEVATSSTDLDGAYRITLPAAGRFTLTAALSGFAGAVHDIELTAESCSKTLDLILSLKSRVAAAAPSPTARPTSTGLPPRAGGPAGRFQEVVVAASGPPSAGAEGPAPGADVPSMELPQGFSADAPTDSVTSTGGTIDVADNNFYRDRMDMLDSAGGDLEAMARRMSQGMDPSGANVTMPGGMGGGGGGMGGAQFFGRGGGSGRERLQGNLSHTFGGSALDAAPYVLNGREAAKADYVQHGVRASLSGPLKLPGIYDGTGRTQFTLGYSGSWDHRPYDAYSTVPTEAERAGDLSGRARSIYDPQTGGAFLNGVIPEARIDPAARRLLEFIPVPNLPGDTQNFHYVTSTRNRSDAINLNFIHRFGPVPGANRQGARPPAPRPSGTGGRAAGGGRRGSMPMGRRTPTLNVTLNYNRGSNRSAGRFPTLGGEGETSSTTANVGGSFGLGRTSHNTRFNFSRNRSDGLNLYAFTRDVAGEAGIGGVADDPFDWGVPNLSFTTFQDLSDRAPTRRRDRRWSVSHSVTYPWKKHSIRVGVELRHQAVDSQTDRNARGSFTFTGLYTSRPGGGATRDGGLDFADFLLGLPQQTSVQYGPGEIGFRSRSWNLYFTDDWRINGALTVTAGLRYEFVSPLEEADGRLVNLDVPPDFSGAATVLAGQSGPFTGVFPDSLVYADHNNVAPRVGVAWTPNRTSAHRTTVRAGYGLNYNLNAYTAIAQNLSAQPPFAVANTSQGTPAAPLTFAQPFVVANESTVTNSYGIDKNYQLGAVQTWNLDVSKELPHGWNVGGGYTGTAGRNLDIQRAPNRSRDGLRIANVQAFLWQSSEGTSSAHALMIRVRRRMGRGFSAGANYMLAKSLDNASSIGGGGMVVAQDDRNLAAERGRSSFDRRHRLSFNYSWQLPFGTGRRWLQKGFWSAVAGGWTWSGNMAVQSGSPFTARVIGDFADVGRGVNGTLRANYTGAPIHVDDPSLERWFNTDAFALPPAGQFGDAGRNTITGPGSFLVNMGLSRDVSLGRPRSLSIRLQANNLLNTPNYTAINTTVSSPLFGQVTSVGPMRSVQLTTSVRF